VGTRHPSIGALVERLRDLGCAPALMSGSGSSVFGVLPGRRGGELPRFAQMGNEPGPRVLLTRSAVAVAEVVVSAE
jgi:4-diphosphocytidyl-2C-methyl-D-erythritol kinase